MQNETQNISVEFFDTQFQGQIRDHNYALNPFEIRALDHLSGRVLDLGSGLGNLSLEAARRGHSVVSVDASNAAVVRINTDAQREGLPVKAMQVDIEKWMIDGPYDTIVCIGLLMFFPREVALELLRRIQENVSPAGIAVVNVLNEGTTYMDMFDADKYYLFARNELVERFAGWKILSSSLEAFPAPDGTLKEFSTVIVEKPS
jgi:tellurite methyltransferase